MPRKRNSKFVDWRKIDAEILSLLDIRQEYLELGVEFAGKIRPDGIAECYAIDRPDKTPSAYVNLETGRYGDSGSSDQALLRTVSLFEFAARFSSQFANFHEAREYYAGKVCVEIPKTSGPKPTSKKAVSLHADWHANSHANLHDSTPENDRSLPAGERIAITHPLAAKLDDPLTAAQVESWTQHIRPGTSTQSLLTCDAQIAQWPRYRDRNGNLQLAPGNQTVLALPVYSGEEIETLLLADPGNEPPPPCYTLYPLAETHLSVWQGKNQPRRQEKKLSIGPTRGSLLPPQAIRHAANSIWINRIWKTAGESDLLALLAAIPADQHESDLALANASGEGADVLPCQIEVFARATHNNPLAIVHVIHDADETGEIGVKKWLIALATAGIKCKQVKLPYPITESHGKDLRDWLLENRHDYAALCKLADDQPLFTPTAEELAEGQRERMRLTREIPATAKPEPSTETAAILPAGEEVQTGQSAATSTTPQAITRDLPLHIGPVTDEDTGIKWDLANYYYQTISKYENGRKVEYPQAMPKSTKQCIEDIQHRTNNAFKVWQGRLFIDHDLLFPEETTHPKNRTSQHRITFMKDGSEVLSLLRHKFPTINWLESSKHTKPRDLFFSLIQHAEQYESIEFSPHEPPIPNTYYACHMPDPQPAAMGNPDADSELSPLDTLVSYFSPGTPEIDDSLIKAMILSLFWGYQGAKPAFAITSSGKGQGSGKTTLVELIAKLVPTPQAPNGLIDFQMGGTIETFDQRIFSDGNAGLRIIRIDNVKSHGLSWGDLEAKLTQEYLNGKKMYVGDCRRRNDFIWIMTMNGISFSRDMAERFIQIQIAPPEEYDPDWRYRVREYIDQNRDAIVEDCIAHLRRKPGIHGPIIKSTLRWSAWETTMLQHFRNPTDIQEQIRGRLEESDIGNDDWEEIEDILTSWLKHTGYDPAADKVYIPRRTMNRILDDAAPHGQRGKERSPSRKLDLLIKEGRATKITIVSTHCIDGRDGFCWNGPPGAYTEMHTRFSNAVNEALDRKQGRGTPPGPGPAVEVRRASTRSIDPDDYRDDFN